MHSHKSKDPCSADSQKSKCSNHRALSQANARRREHLETSGIGATACARHGCFYPHSIVDFQQGERYVKWHFGKELPDSINPKAYEYRLLCLPSLASNCRHRPGSGCLRYLLPVVSPFQATCQCWAFLSLQDTLELIPSIGKFHLGAHVPECFALFSLNFVKGSAQLDGEILETLWSSLNKVASSTRSMSKAHRQEVLDDYMNDSNWKEMVRSGMFSS